jgi:hypothetical protein
MRLTVCIAGCLLIGACASAKSTVYDKAALSAPATWRVDFAYEPGEVEERQSEGRREVRITTEGRSARDLQLRDDILYHLQDKHGIRVTKKADPSLSAILIHPVTASWGYRSVDVVLQSVTGARIARVRVRNGDRNATIKEDDDFAEYAADAIAKLMRER